MILGNPEPGDATSKTLNMLKRLRRLEGTALISSGVLIHSDIPDVTGEMSATFSKECTAMFAEYAEQGKDIEQITLGFDKCNVVLFNRFPVILGLFFADIDTVDSVERAGRQFLTQFATGLGIQSSKPIRTSTGTQAEPVGNPVIGSSENVASPRIGSASEDWSAYSEKVHTLLTKVLGSAQAEKIIKRELAAIGIEDGTFLMKSQFRSFGTKLMQRIRDKALRKQLESELIDFLSDSE